MTDDDLLQEIHRVRDKLARECDYDVHKIGERIRQRQREEMGQGIRYVSLLQRTDAESCVVREDTGNSVIG
jgi:SAM-dependent MidA family methyltransferase